jgi:hypothetical protein
MVDYGFMEWKPINTVPFDRDVEIAVADSKGLQAVTCPCRLTARGWIAAESKRPLYWVRPTHWREWPPDQKSPELENSVALSLPTLF